MRAPPPRGNPNQFGARVSVLHLNGQPWGDRPNRNDESNFFDRPVRINGAIVATVRLRAVQHLPQEHEVRFLRTQYYGIAVVATVLLLLALLAAWWLDYRYVARLAHAIKHPARSN
jgi:hypothetical protein